MCLSEDSLAWKHAKWEVIKKIDSRFHLGPPRKGNAVTQGLSFLKVPVKLFVFLL